jgi:nicotinate-nucleotide adenylyltransferase
MKKQGMQYQSPGIKVQVAVLGGAFDPITRAHMQIASFVLDTGPTFDEVWIMPCYRHIYNKKMASPPHRLAMCSLAASKDCRVKISDYEIKNAFIGGTYHLMKKLLDEEFIKDTYEISLIIGLDNANTFNSWVEHGALEKIIRFVVVPRQGVAINTDVNWYLNPPHIYLEADKPIMKVSSTRVRELLRRGKYEKVRDFLDPDVFLYIREHKLYR